LGLSFSGGNVTSRGAFALFCLALGAVPMNHFWTQCLVENQVKIHVYRAFDWLSSISGAKIMDLIPKIDQNLLPQKSLLGALHRRQ